MLRLTGYYLLLCVVYFSSFCKALLAFRLGKFGESFALVTKALQIYPNHADSLELMEQMKCKFEAL
jgi:hypothetical protein